MRVLTPLDVAAAIATAFSTVSRAATTSAKGTVRHFRAAYSSVSKWTSGSHECHTSFASRVEARQSYDFFNGSHGSFQAMRSS